MPYNPGRYIRLEKEPTTNQEVAQFRADLRNLTNDSLAADGDQYSEQRFLDVKRIIERFRGRDGYAEADKAWTGGSPTCATGSSSPPPSATSRPHEEWEHYSDSDGKSGGQKEKLAYTILAASLAYQFGLEWGAVQVQGLPVRRHRRGVRARLGRLHPIRARAVRQARSAAAHRHAAAEGPRHRALRQRHRLRRQSDRHLLAAADDDDRGVPHASGRTPDMSLRHEQGVDYAGGRRREGPPAVGRRHAPARLRRRRWRSMSSTCRCEVPRPSEIGDDLSAVRGLDRPTRRGRRDDRRYALTWQTIGGRHIGRNQIPVRAVVVDVSPRRGRFWASRDKVDVLRRILDDRRAGIPPSESWAVAQPHRALDLSDEMAGLRRRIRMARRAPRAPAGTCVRSALRASTPSSPRRHRRVLAAMLGVPGAAAGFLAASGPADEARARPHPAGARARTTSASHRSGVARRRAWPDSRSTLASPSSSRTRSPT